MIDNNNEDDDDLLDFSDEDLDDIDDADIEEDWDEFDEDTPAEAATKKGGKKKSAVRDEEYYASLPPPKKKSSLGSNLFFLILILGVCGGAGWFYLNSLQGNSVPPPAQPVAPPIEQQANNAVNPEPTPMPEENSGDEANLFDEDGGEGENLAGLMDGSSDNTEEAGLFDETDEGDLSFDDNLPPMPTPMNSDEASNTLTPMPQFEAQDNPIIEPAPVEANADPVPSQSEEQIISFESDDAVSEPAPFESEIVSLDNNTQNEPVMGDSALAMENANKIAALSEQINTLAQNLNAQMNNAPSGPSDMDSENAARIGQLSDQISQLTASVEQLRSMPMPAANSSEPGSADNAAVLANAQRISALESKLDQQVGSLNNKMDNLGNEIASLNSSIQSLAQQGISKAPQASNNTPAPAPKKQEPVKTVSQPAPKPAKTASEQPQTSTPKPRTVIWQMRSAQPGKAVVSELNSQDMRTVEVGDRLSGIGRITSISVQNGRWVIAGTQGQISQ